jgi:hypothetical protein
MIKICRTVLVRNIGGLFQPIHVEGLAHRYMRVASVADLPFNRLNWRLP